MAKRRLNRRFLRILAASVLGLVALGLVAYRLQNRFLPKHPEKYLAAGQEALAKKDYATARDNFERAAALTHPDATLDVEIGDALNGLSGKDSDNVSAARGMWEQALTVDPTNVPAMERLIHFWRDQLELHPRLAERAQAADRLKKAADNLLRVDPDNHLAKANSAEATIETLLDGIPLESAKVNEAKEILQGIESEDPADAEIPYYVARAYLWQAQEAAHSDDDADQARFTAKADRVMSDAVNYQPDNSLLHYRCGQILLQIAAGQMDNATPSEEAKEYISRGVAEIDLARQYASPDDAHYIDINLYDARLVLERPAYAPSAPKLSAVAPTTLPGSESLRRAALNAPSLNAVSAAGALETDRIQVAQAIYRDVLSHRPNDPATRIAYAELLGDLPGRRDEAIALLSKPMVDDHPTPGIKGTLLPAFQIEANMRLLSLEIDAIEAARDAQQRATLLSTADALCDRVYGKNPDSPTVLGLKGRLELLHNHVVDATQTLKHALELIDPQDLAQQRSRYELMYHLARACEIAQQTGDAKRLAGDIVSVYGRFIPARLMLARLLISEHDFAGAKPHIDFLESLLPTNPELTTTVLRMRIATLDPVNDAAKIKSYFDRLPEDSRDQKVDKAALARLVRFDSEFIRLMSAVHASSPGDAEAAGDLADWYTNHGQKALAVQILQEALAVNPSDSGLIAMELQAQGKNVASSDVGGGTTKPTDAFSGEWAQVEFAQSRGDMAGVDQHLAAAEKLRPDDPRVWDAMWNRAMAVSNWDRASLYLEKLAAANVDHAGGLLYRVHFALAKNDVAKAAELAQQLTREKPEFAQSWCLLAQVQKAEGNYEDAVGHFQQAIELQVQNLEAIRGVVDCSYALGNIDQAKRYIDMGRRVAPSNESFKELALTYDLTYGDPQNVIGPRQEAMAATPDNPQTWLDLASAYVAAAQSRTKAQDSASAADYNQKAKKLLQDALAKFPDDSKFVATYSKLCVDTDDFPSAEQAMLNFSARPSYKGRPKTAVILSEFYELAGKPDQAAKVLSDYLASPYQPQDRDADVGAELHLAGLLARQNHFDQALAALDQNAQDPQVVRERIALLINAHRLGEADKALNDLAAAGPLSPDLLTLKGVAALEGGTPTKLEEARECFDQVLAAQPNNSYALTERAKALLGSSPPDYSAALADLSRARDLVPGDMDTRLMIVDVDRHRNQYDDAIHELESAIRIAPANKRVRLTLIDLYAQSTPPRWSDADQLLRATKQIPVLSDDPDFLHEEAILYRDQHEYAKALQAIRQAMSKAPENLAMVHTYYDILLKTKAFDQLLSESAQLLSDHQAAPALWWVYPYRAQALVHGSGDKTAGAAELELGLNATAALHDAAGIQQVISAYAALIGSDDAIKVASVRAQSDPHWLLLAAGLCQQKGDADATVSWLEMALGKFDALSPADQDTALHLGAIAYMAKSPPDTLKCADMYRRILKRAPADVDALNNLACILVEPGSPEQPNPAFSPREALDDSEKAYNLMIHAGQDQPLIKDTYGWALIANNFNEQGLNMVRDALGKYDFAEGHYHLAEGLLKSQPPSPDDAASELAKAMKLLDQDERDGKPVDDVLKAQVQAELHRARSGMAG